MAFNGFSMEMLMYFQAIAVQNSNEFYYDNLDWYKNQVRGPLAALAEQLAGVVQGIDPGLETRPGKVVSRIRRDTRFTRDKSPFRDHMWICWRPVGCSVGQTASFYFGVDAQSYTVGLGFYDASLAQMNALRAYMLNHPDRLLKSHNRLQAQGVTVDGPSYVRSRPGGEVLPPPLQAWYNRKSFSATAQFGIDPVFFTPQLAERVSGLLTALAPLYDYLKDSGMLNQPPR